MRNIPKDILFSNKEIILMINFILFSKEKLELLKIIKNIIKIVQLNLLNFKNNIKIKKKINFFINFI